MTSGASVRRGRRMLVLVGVLVTAVGCGTEGPPAPPATVPATAPAGPPVTGEPGRGLETLQRALDRRGLEFGADDAETDRYARAICGGLESSVPLPEMVERIQARTGLGPRDTGFVLGAAASSYCPQQLTRLTGR